MASYSTLVVGSSGIYRLREPFSSLLIPNLNYTCEAVRKLADVVSSGIDPFEVYYLRHGISREVYENDVKDGVVFVSLMSSSGRPLQVPSSYIISAPDGNGVLYKGWGISVSLAYLPSTIQLEHLKNRINDLVLDTIGVKAESNVVVIGPDNIVSQTDHEVAETLRQSELANSQTDHSLYLKERARADELATKLALLEQYLIDNQ